MTYNKCVFNVISNVFKDKEISIKEIRMDRQEDFK